MDKVCGLSVHLPGLAHQLMGEQGLEQGARVLSLGDTALDLPGRKSGWRVREPVENEDGG